MTLTNLEQLIADELVRGLQLSDAQKADGGTQIDFNPDTCENLGESVFYTDDETGCYVSVDLVLKMAQMFTEDGKRIRSYQNKAVSFECVLPTELAKRLGLDEDAVVTLSLDGKSGVNGTQLFKVTFNNEIYALRVFIKGLEN